MPAIKKGNAALRIDLAAPEGWTFAPGDTVIGDVVRCSSIVTSNADLKVYLRGRIQTTRTNLSNGNRYAADTKHTAYAQNVASEQILLSKRYPVFEGPLHIPDGGDPVSWSFTTEITPDPPRTIYGNIDIFYGYLPGSTLPGSSGSVALIEYFLEAELRYCEEGQSGEKITTALEPITLRHRPLHEFHEFGIAQQIIERKVRSHHLLPEYRPSALTMKQKAQQIFGSSKVPEVHFQVEVFLPNTIQLDNPSFLPMNLIVLQKKRTSNEIRNVGRKAWINSIKLSLDTFTIVKNHGASLEAGFSQPTNSATSFPAKFVGTSSVAQDLHLEKAIQDANIFPLELIVSDDPIDLGSMLQLILHSDGLSMRGMRLQKVLPITPSLDVYNIRYMNWLKVELSLTMANERFNLDTRIPVKILAAE
ncbi:uncharacterized protein N7483_000118 [Penicillium malachiteum]|uniref:uncharacterized protein n=1 Tax=Penicillium malachiteum TaxID=1324776 RepID=UPI00254671C2|nr:uncharacterized protein N7483_000118 [Penicillium malachiteum]KAJ5734993.1 hypothetical protein N7483_000118 [Penicillium malachiteum]